MDRMNVVAGVAHSQSIPLALLQMECSRGYFVHHRISHAIHRPSVETFFSHIVFRECHLEGLVGCRCGRAGFRETCAVPFESRRSDPLHFSSAARVPHYNPHTVAAVIVREITENPHAWMNPRRD
jgi:hypothetical protein